MPALPPGDYFKEEACMKYINARVLLPEPLVRELQRYIQGGYIYVQPIRHSKSGGEKYPGTGRNCSSETAVSQRSTEMGSLRRNWLKNTVCLYMPYEKLFIRNNRQGPR